ncbi:MAG: hypothetical protein WC107_01970 [Patescibacteria group bacterium]
MECKKQRTLHLVRVLMRNVNAEANAVSASVTIVIWDNSRLA